MEKYIVEDGDRYTRQFKLPLEDLIEKMIDKTWKEATRVVIYDAQHNKLGAVNCGFWYPA